jgi:hypothetical protein
MFGFLFLLGCLACVWFARTTLARYQRSASRDPSLLWVSILGFLGAALNLVAAIVSFFR